MTNPSIVFQPSPNEEEALGRAAALWGVEAGYWDIWGKLHATPPEVQKAILAAMGIPCGTKECLDQAVEERLWREWSRIVPPTLVISQTDEALEFAVTIPAGLAARTAAVEIRWEDGEVEKRRVALGELPVAATAVLRGESFVRKNIPLTGKPPLGYHDVKVSIRIPSKKSLSGTMRLIVAPAEAYLPPQLADGRTTAGIAVSLYGVRSARNWGCGDFTDLKGIAEWAARSLSAGFVALNPLHALHNRQPFNTSPYLPNSIYYRNLIYLDVEALADFRTSKKAVDLLASEKIQAELAELRAAPFVEYERVQALKLRFLRIAFDNFRRKARAGSSRTERFQKYCEREGELLDRFATYCVLDEWIHGRNPEIWVWPGWPEQYRGPNSPAVRAFAKKNERAVEFHKYVQWQLDIQLAEAQEHAARLGMPVGLYHDLALATDHCGSDLWAHRPFYVEGCRVGSPPDDFSPDGQDWAFPPPNAEQHRESGYRLFVESIRKNCRHGGALRIDHVMRFFRLFWIPKGMEASQGTYVRDFHEDLMRILALESVRQKVLIVGEDLGTVEPSVRESLQRFGVLSYRLFYFEKDKQGGFLPPEAYPREALVSVATHDLPTLAGFWLNRDIEARRNAGLLDESGYHAQLAARAVEKQRMLDFLFRLGLLPEWFPRNAEHVHELTGELHNAVTGFLVSTPSMLMALTQEDLFKETEQQNLPGSTWQYPNWRRKMRYSLEELRGEGLPEAFAKMFRDWVERSGRGCLFSKPIQ